MTRLLHHLLAEAAHSTPGAPAVIDGDRTATYAELDAAADRIAGLFSSLGAGPGERVGVFLDKSLESVTALYGILKTGAAYVPIDPRSPAARATKIAADAGLGIIVGGPRQIGACSEIAASWPVEHLVLPGMPLADIEAPRGITVHAADEIAGADPPPAPTVGPDDDAYILYTSGSTGSPKGVTLTHDNAMAFVDWAVDEFAITADDRLSSHAPFHFDLSIFDLYAAAACGASLALVPQGGSTFPGEVAKFMHRHRITVWYSVPSILSMLADRGGLEPGGLPDLRLVLFAGEVFPPKYLRRLMELVPDADFANLYGPTETNVCTFERIVERPDPDGPDPSIGRPIAGVVCHLVAEDGNLVGPGDVGELLVRGPTVMRGYWNDPDKTAAALVDDPIDPREGRCYRTGDLAVLDDDGRYHLRGRRDHQIKSRGYRIELGEIETAINAHPEVVECAVVAVPDPMITNRIEAHVVTRAGCGERDISRYCRKTLPSHMVPQRVTIEEALPRTSTGKIDRQALKTETTP